MIFLSLISYEIISKYNAKWLKIFYHYSGEGDSFKNKSEALKCNEKNKYSILNEINEIFLINNKFEFLLEYPELIGYNRWLQSSNPIFQQDSNALGYEGIDISWNVRNWCGLTLSSWTDSLLDGSHYDTWWFYAVGVYNLYSSNRFPGPDIAINEINLWIRIDGSKFNYFNSNLFKKNFKYFFNYLILIL